MSKRPRGTIILGSSDEESEEDESSETTHSPAKKSRPTEQHDPPNPHIWLHPQNWGKSVRPIAWDVRQRQGEVKEQLVLSQFRGKPNFTELRKSHLRRAYELIDERLLAGQLSKLLAQEGRRLTFRVADRMTSRAGQLTTELKRPKYHELALSSTLLGRTFRTGKDAIDRRIEVNGLPCYDRTDAMLRVVEHELVHLLFLCDAMPAACRKQHYHGALFQRAVKRFFGHSAYEHDLVTPMEEAAVNGGVEAGVTVRFVVGGENLQGKVNRVTKNATVLVPCEAFHQDAREFSDGSFYRKFFIPVERCKVVATT